MIRAGRKLGSLSSSTIAGRADRSGAVFAVCAALIAAAGIVALAGSSWAIVVYLLIVEGAWAAGWLLSAAGIGACIVRLSGIRCESASLFAATCAALGMAIISILVLVLGLMGWMGRPAAVGILVAGWIAGAATLGRQVWNHRSQISEFNFRFRITDGQWLWLLVVPIATAALVAAAVVPGVLWGDEPHGYDVLEYHLQVPREWYELGRIVPLKHNVFSYFPFNVEMHYLLAMHVRGGPWAAMYLAQLMHLAFIATAIVAIHGVVREVAGPRAAIGSALLAAGAPWMTMLGGVAYNEGGLLLFGTLSIGWTLLGMRQEHRLRPLALAGAMAGFACGAKLTAAAMVLASVPAAIVIAECTRPLRAIRSAAVFLLAGIVTFSPWLIRNALWTGNPVFPEASGLLGRGPFTPIQQQRWIRAHSPREDQRPLPARLRAFAAQNLVDWRYGYAVLPVGVMAAALSLRRRETLALSVVLMANAIVWLGFTHLQGRFFILSIPLVAMLAGLVQLPWWRWLVLGAALIAAGTALAQLSPRIVRASSLIGLEDYRLILPEVAGGEVLDGDRPIVLVGDAQAFRWPVPMSRLRYRTVFDVDARPDQSVIDAWIGPDAPRDAIIIVDPASLRRFARTYWGIPPFEGTQTQMFILDSSSRSWP
ncbi:ArnT family glycosyltransferase [Fontivita pretiosa]|uniref:ArnT family glycosyltransferase n=1 Tax=Fontivita pretiosa TaxID=2989684 RepID=UPI003D170E25